MSGPSSNTSPTASAFYDPDSSSWRTSQGSLLSELHPLLERLPDWGMTAGGALSAQAIPERLTVGRDGSASPNLPTPAAWDGARGPDLARAKRPNSGGMDLVTVTERLLPTPTTVDSKVFGPNVDWQLRLLNHAPHTASALMALRLNDGNESSDGLHPHPPTTGNSPADSSNG